MQVAIDKLPDVLRGSPHLGALINLCAGKDAYLVGGAIRDALLGRPVIDLDLIFPADPTPLAKTFARQIAGHWFWLDKTRLQSRVVVNQETGCLHYDFAPFRAADLFADLCDRDFTINALALPFAGELNATLLDPLGGLSDLRQGVLRMIGQDSLNNDPLRIIKGVRHATVLGLEVETATMQAMQQERAGLKEVAPERIRQEIWKILADRNAGQGLEILLKCRAGESLFGKAFVGSFEKLSECQERCQHSWQDLAEDRPVVRSWLAHEIEQGLNNQTLLLFTFLTSSIAPELPALMAKRWRLSRKSQAYISALTALDEATVKEFADIARNERAYAWWSVRYRIDPRLLLLAMAASGLTISRQGLVQWVPLVDRIDEQDPDNLVDGHWLRDVLCLEEGVQIGEALDLLREAEISGAVCDAAQARRFLKDHYQNKD